MAGIGHNSGGTEDDGPKKLPAYEVFNRASLELAKVKQERKALGERARDAVNDFKANGGSKLALQYIRRFEEMDPDDRDALLAEIDCYLGYRKFL
jgi:hypothetical protein